MSVAEEGPVQSEDKVFEFHFSEAYDVARKRIRLLIAGGLVAAVLGGIYAFSRPNEFTSQISVLPEIQAKGSSNLGNLGSLAGLAGIDIGSVAASGTDAVRPDLYPNVLQSAPFALTLFKKPVYVSKDKRTELFEAYLTEKTKSWLGDLLSFGKTDEVASLPGDTTQAIRMTKAQESLLKEIQKRITGTYDKKTYMLTVTTTMPDASVAADVVRHTLIYLTNYVTSYRTEKSRREVEFLNRQVASARQRYQAAEYALATYRDQNRSTYLNTTKIEEQRIQAEFLLSQDLYNTLSKQAEMAKIKVQEETPVFKVLEPARIPLEKSGPKRSLIILGAGAVGFFISFVYAFIRRAK